MEMIKLDVFTATAGLGNPAGVILDADHFSTAEMQAQATKAGLELAFVLKAQSGGTYRFRYFSPLTEMNLCAHATIGALWALGQRDRLAGECRVETGAGLLKGGVEFSGEKLQRAFMELPDPTFQQAAFDRAEVAQALGLPPEEIIDPLVAASTGRAKLLVPLPGFTALDHIQINPAVHAALCQQHDLTGLYPYTLKPRNPGVAAEARQFPFGVGIFEDPVTGVAMGGLAAWLVASGKVPQEQTASGLVIEQGHATGRPGRAEVRVRASQAGIESVQLRGTAVESAP